MSCEKMGIYRHFILSEGFTINKFHYTLYLKSTKLLQFAKLNTLVLVILNTRLQELYQRD